MRKKRNAPVSTIQPINKKIPICSSVSLSDRSLEKQRNEGWMAERRKERRGVDKGYETRRYLEK